MVDTSLAELISHLPNISGAIAESLADMIYGGKLRPGERLVQSKLAEQFGVSRLPVRDALHLLEQRSLVVTRPRRGVVVRPVDRRELRDAFRLRRVLEPIAMEEAVAAARKADFERLDQIILRQEESLRACEMAAVVRLDQQFHECIFALAENQLLREMIHSLWTRIHQARSVVRVSVQGKSIGERSAIRHRELLEALRRGDAGELKRITVHIIDVAEREILGELRLLGWIEEEN